VLLTGLARLATGTVIANGKEPSAIGDAANNPSTDAKQDA